MRKPPTLSRIVRLALIALAALATAPSMAPAQQGLPSSVKSRVKRINTRLDQAVQALDLDRLTTAQRKLKEAQKILKEINDRYAGKFAADEPTYKAMTDRLAEVAARIQATETSAKDSADKAKKAREANEALCNAWVEKLSPFTDYKHDLYLRYAAEFNSASEEDQAKSRAAYPKAKALFEEYLKVTFPQDKTGMLQHVESKLASLLKYYGEEEAQAKQELACQEWVELLSPFVRHTAGSRKILIASATADAESVKRQQAIYEEARKAFERYQAIKLPLGKSQRLEQIEQELKKRLDAFPAAMAQSQAMISGDVAKRAQGILAHLTRDSSWKSDPKKKPPTIMERDLKPLREAVQRFAGTVKADDLKLKELKTCIEAIETKNREHRLIQAQRTFQRPDAYTGDDLAQLKTLAQTIAAKAHAGGKALRTTVPTAAWSVEDVVEFTDTSRTALRRRITRSVRAEVAVQKADGGVLLQEVYLGQDRLPDGSWGPLKGHTTWADAMAKENVGKDAPK
jgi:hypothetical protein